MNECWQRVAPVHRLAVPSSGPGRRRNRRPRYGRRPMSETHGARPIPRPLRVLVVDDDRDGADSLCLLLGLHGHDCRVAYDTRAALAEADSFRPEVALLDLGMPV